MSSDDTPSRIKTVSVGVEPTEHAAPATTEPPPYRILVAGDFGLRDEPVLHRLSGRDTAELLSAWQPSISVEVENRLGSLPTTVSETVRLSSLKDLRPDALVGQFNHIRVAQEALKSGNLASHGQRFDALSAAKPGHAPTPARLVPSPKSGPPSEPAGDGLDALFELIDAPDAQRKSDADASALISAFIAETSQRSDRQARTTDLASNTPAAAALAEQGRLFLEDERLRQVVENWHGLRLLLATAARERSVRISLIQLSTQGAVAATSLLADEHGVLNRDYFDVIVCADRCSASHAGAETLKALATGAQAFGTVALATLTKDFARVPAEDLVKMDAPHQVLDVAGFEAFNDLRGHSAAANLGLFWNDVLIAEATKNTPAYYYPATFIASIVIVKDVVTRGWPGLHPDTGMEPSGFAVATHRVRGREIAHSTRVFMTDDCAASLSSAGIATLTGRADRDSVRPVRTPTIAGPGKDQAAHRGLESRLVVARLNQVLQGVLAEVMAADLGDAEKAGQAKDRLAACLESMAGGPKCTVDLVADDEGLPLLDIAVTLPEGLATTRRFEFQVSV